MKKEQADGRSFLLTPGIWLLISYILNLWEKYDTLQNPFVATNEYRKRFFKPNYMKDSGNLYNWCMIAIFFSLIKIIFSIFYIKWSNNPKKATTLLFILYADIILGILFAILPSFLYKESFDFAFTSILDMLFLPIIMFIGIKKNKNMLED